MNKFEIPSPSGGHIVTAHDFNFIYNSLAEGINGLSSFENCIISGCRPTYNTPNYTISPGFLCIEGEIYAFPGGTFSVINIPDPCFVPVESVDPLSPRTAADSQQNNVHFKRIVEIQEYDTQPVKYRFDDLADFGMSFKTVVNNGTGSLEDIEFRGNFAQASSTFTNLGYELLKLKKYNRELVLTGIAEANSTSSTNVLQLTALVFNLEPLKPLFRQGFGVLAGIIDTGTIIAYETVFLSLDTDGLLSMVGPTTSGDGLILFFNHKLQLF